MISGSDNWEALNKNKGLWKNREREEKKILKDRFLYLFHVLYNKGKFY